MNKKPQIINANECRQIMPEFENSIFGNCTNKQVQEF